MNLERVVKSKEKELEEKNIREKKFSLLFI